MDKKAVRLQEEFEIPENIPTNQAHLEHMYSGLLSKLYYRRFDQALNLADLNSSDRVLEVGGGTGVFLVSLIRHCDDVYFSDVSLYNDFETPQILINQFKSDADIHFIDTDVTSLGFDGNSFDKVFAMDMLEHVPQEEQAIEELSRILDTDGQLIVSAPMEIGFPLLVREIYRFIDGNRRRTETFSELLAGAVGNPPIRNKGSHRGYDYRRTIAYLEDVFTSVSFEFCPVPALGEANPQVIINAKSPK
jgi:ubiquinone/menaquinone biosynthesis C-methylase UbiE